MEIATVLPLAIVMVAGPQIVTAFFFATSEGWARNSLTYVGGAAISVTGFVTIAYATGNRAGTDPGESGAGDDTIYWIILVLIAVVMLRTYLARHESEPPRWMGRLQRATPKLAFTLGLLLLGVFPTDILTSTAVGLRLGAADVPWSYCLPFIAVTLLLLGAPALAVVFMGQRAERVLPQVRNWMSDNAWIVNEAVLTFFAVVSINSITGS